MADDPYSPGIRAKLDLCELLQAEQVRLRKETGFEDGHAYESSNNLRDSNDPSVWVEWRLTKAPDPIPLSFSAHLGDAIHNFRAALDYSLWAAVTDTVRRDKPTAVQFPYHRKLRHHRDWVAEREGWVNDDVFEVLDWAQPYHADKNTIHPLRVLQVLSNTDKHRLLNVVTHAHISQGIHLNPEPPTYDFWAADGPVNVGDPIARLTYPRPPFNIEMDVAPGFGWYESVA